MVPHKFHNKASRDDLHPCFLFCHFREEKQAKEASVIEFAQTLLQAEMIFIPAFLFCHFREEKQAKEASVIEFAQTLLQAEMIFIPAFLFCHFREESRQKKLRQFICVHLQGSLREGAGATESRLKECLRKPANRVIRGMTHLRRTSCATTLLSASSAMVLRAASKSSNGNGVPFFSLKLPFSRKNCGGSRSRSFLIIFLFRRQEEQCVKRS